MYKCHECDWIDADPSFFTEEAGHLYCSLHRSLSMLELSQLTHETQVERFGFCTCEEQESFPYADCPVKTICDDCDETATVTRAPYGDGIMLVYNCPNCGESYDTNYDGSEK